MTIILELPPSVEAAIQQDAARQGTTPEALALEGLRRMYPEAITSALRPKTGAEALAIMRRDNLFVNREGQPDSPELARQIREKAWKRL